MKSIEFLYFIYLITFIYIISSAVCLLYFRRLCCQTTSWCDETSRSSSQLAQIYGYVFTSTDFLLALQRFHLGPWKTRLPVPNLHMCCPQTMPWVHNDQVFRSQKQIRGKDDVSSAANIWMNFWFKKNIKKSSIINS